MYRALVYGTIHSLGRELVQSAKRGGWLPKVAIKDEGGLLRLDERKRLLRSLEDDMIFPSHFLSATPGPRTSLQHSRTVPESLSLYRPSILTPDCRGSRQGRSGRILGKLVALSLLKSSKLR